MKHVLFFCFLLASVISVTVSPALAGAGKISGRILDANNEGAMANILVTEVNQGATADVDGNYVILNVPPGNYTVRITMVGYGPQTFKNVSVSSDLTTTLNATLSEQAITIGERVVEWEKPAVVIDKPYSGASFTKHDIDTRPVADMKDLLSKQPGFKVDPAGEMHVRGGRGSEMLVKVDGQDFRDPLVTGSKQLVNMSALNVEEIEVMTGGDARYGGFQAALINVTTPEGSMTDYSGILEFRTDRLFKPTDPYKPFHGQSNDLWHASFNQDQYDYSLSGPFPFADKLLGPKKLSFFTSGTARMGNTYTPYNVSRNPADILGIGIKLPERQNNDYSTFWKFTYRMDQKRKLNFSFQRDYSLWDIYPDGEAAVDGNYGWQYKYDVANRPFASTTRQSYNLSFSHNVSKTTLYEVNIGNFNTTTTIQPRGKNPDQFTLATNAEDDNIKTTGGVDQNKDGFPDGYVDANRNGKYDGWGEGYYDANGNGKYDRGEDWVDLNHNGVYDQAEPWVDVPDPVTGRNNIGVKDPWDPYVDLNHNGRWDPAEPQLPEQDWNHNGKWDGERFQDANHDGKYEGFGEGYDDKNMNGSIDKRDLFSASGEAFGEPYIDGDYWNDTGEPFIDLPDSNGNYDGIWEPGEFWYDLPSSFVGPFQRSAVPTTNGSYDGPNGAFDEYELFTYSAKSVFGADPRFPVLYTFGDVSNGMLDPHGRYTGQDWLYLAPDPAEPLPTGTPQYFRWIEGKSTWRNATLDDGGTDETKRFHWIFDPPNNQWDNGHARRNQQLTGGHVPVESFTDYNGNGTQDNLPDFFLNPGQWDNTALWEKRQATEWSAKFDLTSQVNTHHELKTGFEMKYRILTMNSISGPDQVYSNTDIPLPPGSPYPDRGAIRDFYKHRPWEGAVYFQDKMEFEGLIVRAGLRSDFVIQPNDLINATQQQIDLNQPGALLAQRGRYTIAPRLGISHPITDKSKLYFNYGHYYQTPQFQYFYQSATANLSPNTLVGNPNLEYEKTVSYEVGVNTMFAEDWVVDVAGYYRDVFNQIGTVQFRDGPLVFNRYFNLGYARARGFEFSLEKKFSSMWALTANYDFSYAYGKESAAADGLLNRNVNAPENYDEHPLNWDQTHSITAFLTLMVSDKDHPKPFGLAIPNNWLCTIDFSYGSGYPYTPGGYLLGLPADQFNNIVTNSARMPATISTDLKFDKFWNVTKKIKVATGFEIYNLLNRSNVRAIYPATGTTSVSVNPADPTWVPGRSDSDMNPRNYGAPRQILLHLKLQV